MNKIHRLELYTSMSRARDTYGYTIVGLKNEGKRWRTCGGGYDMRGTVLADYFSDCFGEKLKKLVSDNSENLEPCNYAVKGYQKIANYYGLTVTPGGLVQLDGGCGINCIENIIRACGFGLEYSCDKKGNLQTYYLQSENE